MYRAYGGWTFAFDDYYDLNITGRLDDPNMPKMAAIVDPYCESLERECGCFTPTCNHCSIYTKYAITCEQLGEKRTLYHAIYICYAIGLIKPSTALVQILENKSWLVAEMKSVL